MTEAILSTSVSGISPIEVIVMGDINKIIILLAYPAVGALMLLLILNYRSLRRVKNYNDQIISKNERIQNIIEASNAGTWELNCVTNELWISDRCAEIVGYLKKEITPITVEDWMEFVYYEDLDLLKDRMNSVFNKEKESFEVEFRMNHKDGQQRWVNNYGKVVKWKENNTPSLLIGTVIDITKRKKLEETNRDNEQRYKSIISVSNTGAWEFNSITKEQWSSREYYEMLGYDPDDFNGDRWSVNEHWEDLLHPDDFSEAKKTFVDYINDPLGKLYENTFRMRTAQGGWKWILARGKTLTDDSGRLTGLTVGTHIDLTDIKMKEEELKHAHKLMSYVIEHNNGGVAIFDKEMRYVYFSERFRSQFELTGDIIGLSHYELFPDIPEKFKEAHRKSLNGTVVSFDRDTFMRKSGKFDYTRWETRPWYDINGNIGGIIIYVEIITDQVNKEKELEHSSYHDYLTGAFNRRYLSKYFKEIDSPFNYPIGLIMIDINGLKLINDAFGTSAGDNALKTVSNEIDKLCENIGILARVGGDEFVVLTTGKSAELIDRLKYQLQENISKIDFRKVKLSISIGYHLKDNDDTSIEKLFELAETDMYKRKLLDARSIRNSSIRGILQTLTDKYEEERMHSERVSIFCREMGIELGIDGDDLKELEISGMLHDIGKISIPDNILDKPGRLTEDEFEIIKSHTERGYNILRAADEFSDIAIYALSHHERFDGKGYPNGIKDKEIPLFSRIISISDAYEAMTANRTYRNAMPKEDAMKELIRCSGTQFDPDLVEIFVGKVAGRA
jgi:diguanylate cyclase (GGDEF)-like protein/PAS domain S-box-containing protein